MTEAACFFCLYGQKFRNVIFVVDLFLCQRLYDVALVHYIASLRIN